MEQYLRIFGNELQNDWANQLPMAQFVHNSWPHEVTKRTPFELLIGANPRTITPTTSQKIPALEERRETLEKTRWLAQKAMIRAQNLMRQTKGKKTFTPYTLQQKVWLEATNLKTTHPTTKLAPRRYGPFTITEVISPVTYRLRIPEHWKIHNVFHASLLSPYIETPMHGPNFEEPPPELIDDEPEWEVEAILDSRRFGRKKTLQFRVRWKGYSAAHDSWEPANNVHAPELVKRYYKSKGSTVVKNVTLLPPVRICTMEITPTSAASTPSYLQEIAQQFEQHPLPDFTLLGTPDTFELRTTYHAQDPDSPEVPTPPPITVSPMTHESLVERMEEDVIHREAITSCPGDGWELAEEATHLYRPMINDPRVNILHEAKWVKFVINKETGEPQMWGSDGRGKEPIAQALFASPCYTTLASAVDDTDLAPFADINLLNRDYEQGLLGINNPGVMADVWRLRTEPIHRQHLERMQALKNRIYAMADALQDDYRDELAVFHQKQQDVRRRLVQARVRTHVHQAMRGRGLVHEWTDDMFHGLRERSPHASEESNPSLHSNDIEVMDPAFSSSSNGDIIRGNPPRHNLAWHVRAARNVCKFCLIQGHFSKYCTEPHRYCARIAGGRCLVSPRHLSYAYQDSFMDCPFRGQTNAVLVQRGVLAIVTYRAGDEQLGTVTATEGPAYPTTVVVLDD